MKLTDAQLAALEHLQHCHGPSWKATLRGLWSTGKDESSAPLRQLRNHLGWKWLDLYRKGDTHVGWLTYGEHRWMIADEQGHMWSKPNRGTKTEARNLARQLKITLIEEQ